MKQGNRLSVLQQPNLYLIQNRTDAEPRPLFSEILDPRPSGVVAQLFSVALHCLFVLVLLIFGMLRVEPFPKFKLRNTMPLLVPLEESSHRRKIPLFKTEVKVMEGGGGGGTRLTTPASRGRPPRPAPKQFIPPSQKNTNLRAQLLVVPTIVADFNPLKDNQNLSVLGLPNIQALGPPSDGQGSGGGIGTGDGTGLGEGMGPGWGPGNGGGKGGGTRGHKLTLTGGITAPQLISRVEPEYTPAAYEARLQGKVTLKIVVGVSGAAQVIQVVKGLGMGLDEKAVEAVRQWRFRPATREGQPFALTGMVDVYFRLE
ncbi:MAG: energy transducer TonB [Patescibacteria group bacterium]